MGDRAEVITTRGTAGPIAFGQPGAARFFCAVLANRGEENVPVPCTSFPAFTRVFGEATKFSDGNRWSTGAEEIKKYFEKGGRQAIVTRIVGTNAVTADSTIVDQDGTPEDTITVTAKGAGTWGNRVDVTFADGTLSNTFKMTVEVYDFDDSTLLDTEVFDNLKVLSGDIAKVNNQSQYVRLTDEGSSTAAPDNRPANAAYDLGADGSAATAGVDDNAPAAALIVGTSSSGVRTGLKSFRDEGLGFGFIVAPDLDTDATVVSELQSQAASYFRQYLSATDEGANVAAAGTQRGNHDSIQVGFSYPRMKVRDALTDEVKTIPGVGFIAGAWSKVIGEKGPGKNPAGRDFRLTHALGLETQTNGQPLVDSGVAESLLAQGINPWWDADGNGPTLLGARTAGSETAWRYMAQTHLYNLIAYSARVNLQQFIYEVADPLLFQNIKLGIRAFLIDLWNAGAFNGAIPAENEDPDPAVHAFAVDCSEELLSALDKQNGNLRVKIWFRSALVAETIYVDVAKQTEL